MYNEIIPFLNTVAIYLLNIVRMFWNIWAGKIETGAFYSSLAVTFIICAAALVALSFNDGKDKISTGFLILISASSFFVLFVLGGAFCNGYIILT